MRRVVETTQPLKKMSSPKPKRLRTTTTTQVTPTVTTDTIIPYDQALSFEENFNRNGVTDPKMIKVLNDIATNEVYTYTNSQIFDICISYARNPYQEHTKKKRFLIETIPENEWTKVNDQVVYNTTIEQIMNVNLINLINLIKDIDKNVVITNAMSPNRKIMYHVTNWRGINSIIENGIDLGKARECLDFGQSKSFYLAENESVAIEYVKKRRNWYKQEMAIAVFSVPPIDSLPNAKKFPGPNKEWKEFIKYSRQCNKSKTDNVIESLEFIYGPMCSNPEPVKNGSAIPKVHDFTMYQLAVKQTGLQHIKHIATIFCDKSEDLSEYELGGGGDDYMSYNTHCTYDDVNTQYKCP